MAIRIQSQVRIGPPFSLYDADAQAFITAAGITDLTQKIAINNLVLGLKLNSLWSKILCLYPFVGGSATTNKFNLKNPVDINSAFRLQFFGFNTHTNGYQPNGLNAYANSFFIPSSNLTLNSEHIMVVSNTNSTPLTVDSIDIGALNSATQTSLMAIRGSSAKNLFQCRFNSNIISVSNTNSIGSFCVNKLGSTTASLYKNGTSVASGTSAGTLSSLPVYIGTLNLTSVPYPDGYTNQNYTFISYGNGLTSSEISILHSLQLTFNTTLGR
jgi:hypothetical protein